MNEKELLDKMAYKHYEVCRDFGMRNDPDRDYGFATAALLHFKSPKREWDWQWRSDEEDFSMVGDIYNEYELERAKDPDFTRSQEGGSLDE